VTHRQFEDLVAFVGPGDLLVLNDTRVIPAWLIGQNQSTWGKGELLLVWPEGAAWACLGQAAKALKLGQVMEFEGNLKGGIAEVRGGGGDLVEVGGRA